MIAEGFPLPDVSWPPLEPFWTAAALGDLVIPRCERCRQLVWYPQERCSHCEGPTMSWTKVSGRGTLFSWAVVRHAWIPQLASAVPFVSALVALDEDPGVRLVTRVVDAVPEELVPDQAVQVTFRPLQFEGVDGTVLAPFFKPLTSA